MKKNMQNLCKFLMQTIAFLLLSVAAMAQNVVSGKVTDANGAAVPGATVTLKGTSTATQTLSDGTFKITTPKSTGTLVFTSIGFINKEVPISGTAMNVSLITNPSNLGEVVVTVAYGTRKKSDLTGAVTQVGTKDFQKGAIATSEQLLVGKVAGLQITSGGGSATDVFNVVVYGVG